MRTRGGASEQQADRLATGAREFVRRRGVRKRVPDTSMLVRRDTSHAARYARTPPLWPGVAEVATRHGDRGEWKIRLTNLPYRRP